MIIDAKHRLSFDEEPATDFKSSTLQGLAIELGPYETSVADLSSLLSSLLETAVSAAGLKVEFSGKAGSLIAALSSIDQSGSEVIDVPLFDVDAKVYKAGNHPFRLDANTQTIAFVKNAGLRPTTAIVIIRYAGGEWTPELLKLKAGETLAIDLRQLRDSRAKDVRGRRLPENLTEGQFIWYPHRTEPLVGRAVLIDTSAGTASNFSCSNCYSANFDHLEHFPASFNGVPGDSQQMTISEFDQDSCSQLLFGPYDVTNQCEYSSDNTLAATVSATGMVKAAAAGAATLTMTYPFAQTTQFNGFDCTTTTSAVSDSTPGNVCNFSIGGNATSHCTGRAEEFVDYISNQDLRNPSNCFIDKSDMRNTCTLLGSTGDVTLVPRDSDTFFNLVGDLDCHVAFFAGPDSSVARSISISMTIKYFNASKPLTKARQNFIQCTQ